MAWPDAPARNPSVPRTRRPIEAAGPNLHPICKLACRITLMVPERRESSGEGRITVSDGELGGRTLRIGGIARTGGCTGFVRASAHRLFLTDAGASGGHRGDDQWDECQ
jgi:hypothetical protein